MSDFQIRDLERAVLAKDDNAAFDIYNALARNNKIQPIIYTLCEEESTYLEIFVNGNAFQSIYITVSELTRHETWHQRSISLTWKEDVKFHRLHICSVFGNMINQNKLKILGKWLNSHTQEIKKAALINQLVKEHTSYQDKLQHINLIKKDLIKTISNLVETKQLP